MDKTLYKIHSSCLFTNRTWLDSQTYGKIRVTTLVDGVDGDLFTFLHPTMAAHQYRWSLCCIGTSGNGETYYNAYGWTELADVEGFIYCFSIIGRYKIVEDGVNKNYYKMEHTARYRLDLPTELWADTSNFSRKVWTK